MTDLRSEPVEAIDLAEARDRELVQGIRRRDEEAFRGLFGRYAPSAKSLAMRVVRQSHLAEEIVQEAFMALWRNPAAYDDQRGSVKSWLMGMVHHRAVDLVRREESYRRRAEKTGASGDRSGDRITPTRSWSRSGCPKNDGASEPPWTSCRRRNERCWNGCTSTGCHRARSRRPPASRSAP